MFMAICEKKDTVIEILTEKGYDVSKISEDTLIKCGLSCATTARLLDITARLLDIETVLKGKDECYNWGLEHIRAELDDMNNKICKELDKIRGDIPK